MSKGTNGKKKDFNYYIQRLYRYKIDEVLRKIMLPFLKKRPLNNIILIESHNDFDCNGGAFYDYLIEKGYNKKYKIVWLLRNKNNRKLPENVEAVPLFKPSIKKNYYICMAKFFLADCNVTKKVRKGQISIYCTHGGITFKNVKGILCVSEQVDYVLCASNNYAPLMCDNYSIPYPNNRMVDIGFPSNDIFFKDGINEVKKITKEKYNKVFLWMPTFRKSKSGRQDSSDEQPFGVPLIETKEQLNKLNKFLQACNSLLIIKIHPMQDKNTVLQLKRASNIIVLDGDSVKELGVDTYALMASADAMISDYSSAAYSYLITNRPLAFVLSDLKDYKLGFSVDNIDDYLVGHKIYTFDDFTGFMNDVIISNDVYKEKRSELLDWIYEYKDGNASERLAEFIEKL